MKYRILCTDGFAKSGLARLEADSNLEVEFCASLSHEELIDKIEGFDGLIVRSSSKVSRDVIERGKGLKVIARAGVGTDNIDIDAATERGIMVVNAPAGNTTSTAELTFSMILALARHIPQAARLMAEGKWEKKRFKGSEIAHKKLGIIGMGRIGYEVAKRALAFDMIVLGFDPYLSDEKFESLGVKKAGLEEICRQADYITIHTPLTKETENLIAAKEIGMMKQEACIVNCARGGIVNERDLANALKEGRITGAALDVFTKEPFDDTIFQGLDNCILTPHLGASTAEAQDAVAVEAAAAVSQYFSEGISPNAVNLAGADGISWQKFKNHISLSEKLGSLVSQLAGGGISKITLICQSGLPRLITLAAIKGAFEHLSDGQVTFVNAEAIARGRGVAIAGEVTGIKPDFAEAFGIKITTSKGEFEAWGAVLPDGTTKITNCGEYRVEIDPEGAILFIHNVDRPGVIGGVCTVLGSQGINIAEMQNVRKSQGTEALTIIGVDKTVDAKSLEKIAEVDGVTDVKLVRL
ncbi:MAG: phosphoglycerate dehydrogenase [Pseudomonadota bacterium]